MTISRYEFPDSLMLASCEYNDTEKELSVEFENGRLYTYENVPEQTYNDLINAKSAGKYFNLIKGGLVIK